MSIHSTDLEQRADAIQTEIQKLTPTVADVVGRLAGISATIVDLDRLTLRQIGIASDFHQLVIGQLA